MKERWFNYRPILLTFSFLLLGSLFAFYYSSQMVLSVSIALLGTVLLIALAVYKKKIQYVLVALISLIIGFGAYELAVYNFNQTIDYVPTNIEARVVNISNIQNGRITLELDSCLFNDESADGNMIIYVYDSTGLFEGLEIGREISFKPLQFYKTDLFYHGTPNANMYASNRKYTATVNISSIELKEVNKTWAEFIKQQIKDNLYIGLSNENAELAYSTLFGEKEMLSSDVYSAYRLSGVAHLLAVSGLHVGIIVLILSFILKKCRAKDWVRLLVISIFLMLYLSLCNFTVSAIRASIMAIVLILADLLHRDYDSFNAISLAGIVIFAINPLSIFDVSFLMSFACAFGIALLYKTFLKGFLHIKCPKYLSEALSLSLATTISLLFVMAYYFQTLNVISLIANIVIIPLFTVAFVCIFLSSILSLIFPYIMYLMYPINYLLNFITLLSNIFGNLPISNFTTIKFDMIAIVLYYLIIVIMSRLCTAKNTYKVLATLPMIVLLVWCLIY